MIRYIKELSNPSLKCERKGHVSNVVDQRILERCNNSLLGAFVVYDCKIDTCKRCSKRLSAPFLKVPRKYFHGVSMPPYRWEAFEKQGFMIWEY